MSALSGLTNPPANAGGTDLVDPRDQFPTAT